MAKFNCKCGGEVTSSPKAYQCDDCNAIVWKNFYGENRTEAQIKKLFEGEVVSLPCSFEGKRGLPKSFKIDSETKKVVVVKTPPVTIDYNCGCGGTIEAEGAKHVCQSCKAEVWNVMSKVRLTDEQMETIFSGNGNRVYLKDLVGKNGSKFDAWVVLDEETKKTKYEFDEGPNGSVEKEMQKEKHDAKIAEIKAKRAAEGINEEPDVDLEAILNSDEDIDNIINVDIDEEEDVDDMFSDEDMSVHDGEKSKSDSSDFCSF